MRPLLIALALSLIFPSSLAPADTPACPPDTVVEQQQMAAGHRLYAVMHTSKGWMLMIFGTPKGDGWWAFAVNWRHEACPSADGDHLEIVTAIR